MAFQIWYLELNLNDIITKHSINEERNNYGQNRFQFVLIQICCIFQLSFECHVVSVRYVF